MNSQSKLFVIFSLFFVVPALVQAVPVEVVALYNCTMSTQSPSLPATSGTLACSADAWSYCRVVDTTGGTINSATFTFKSASDTIPYPALLYNGTTTDGVWAVNFAVQSEYGDSLNLSSVSATSSTGQTCGGSSNVNSELCLLEYGSYRSLATSCACNYVVQGPVCVTNNVAVTHYVASADCEGNQSYDTYSVCDYCDPQWTVSYSICTTDRNSATPFVGNATKTYTSGNPACCASTGLPSDCTPPPDANSNVQCKMDYWASSGKNTEGNSLNQEVAQATTLNITSYSVDFAGAAIGNVSKRIRPLVFDVDNDGNTEIVAFKDGGIIEIYSHDLQTLKYTITTGFDAFE
jgi:hypothetical protein